MSLLWALLIFRAANLQLVPDRRLAQLQEKQFQTVVTLQNRRGAILDRNGRELAMSVTAYSLFADPQIMQVNRKKLARKLSSVLPMSYENIYSKISDRSKRFVWIERSLPKEKYEEIRRWDIRGLSFFEEPKRVYPNESLLGPTLGFVGGEGQGLEGLELYYEKQLMGDKKRVSARRDARGRPLLVDGLLVAESDEGSELRLTADSDVQHMLEKELTQAVSDFEADQAFGVVLNAKTSAILAMANTTSFDPNRASKFAAENRRNRLITDVFEPGSVMKTFAIATALREKLIAPNTRINTENGRFVVGDRVIREADTKHKWPNLTVSEILAYSSNIGTTKIAFQLGAYKLRQGLLDFGFGQKLGVDLPGESKGVLQPLPWRNHLLSNVSFGHGTSVTALQLAAAYAAIANGGVLRKPYIVDSLKHSDSGLIEKFQPQDVRRVLSEEEAASMRMMLAGVTSGQGTGVNAQVDGFVVAGKTGTAQKVSPDGRGYMSGAYVSSFAGFIPANNPEFVIFIMVDHPKQNSYYGSAVAAPVFSRVASYLVRKDGVAPLSISTKSYLKTAGNITKSKEKIRSVSAIEKPKSSGEITEVAAQNDGELAVIPDLSGMTPRAVLQKFIGQPVDVQIRGTGTVADVIPAPGTPINETKKIIVIFR